MDCIISAIVGLIGGGAAGAFLTRYFTNRDRSLRYLNLKVVEEQVESIHPINIRGDRYSNLVSKKFTLKNTAKKDLESFDLIFEFDKSSTIVEEQTKSGKGIDAYKAVFLSQNELAYTIEHLNRDKQIHFKFKIGNITANHFNAIIDKCLGIELSIEDSKEIKQPEISPAKVISKDKIR